MTDEHTMKLTDFDYLIGDHHLQMMKMAEGISGEQSLLDQYIRGFAWEGMAVKFCNNAEGVISRRIEPDQPPDLGVPSIPLLNEHFPEHFRLFCETVERIRVGAFTAADMEQQWEEVWFNAYLYGDAMAELQNAPKAGLPYCAGYACGYHLVKHYLKKTGKSVTEATLLPAKDILDAAEDFWND